MAAAPFLPIRCLFELAKINKAKYPLESDILERDFYFDDVLTGASTINELKSIKQNLTQILNQAGFELTKFKSNASEIGSTEQNSQITTNCKALGVTWNPELDQFIYVISPQDNQRTVSKRTILSNTAQLFDLMGMLAPVIVIAKLIIQDLWLSNVGWDEAVPMEIHTRWFKLKNELNLINLVKVPRFVLIPNFNYIEIHGFSDASEKAYGACIYIKSTNSDKQTAVHLLAAKSRVAPTKNLSLPRLELQAAVTLSELMHKFKSLLQLDITKTFYWTDSTIVLAWINSHPNKWSTFVANRVATIQNTSEIKDWYHVSTSENPADIISRGLHPDQLLHNHLWWEGPTFLKGDSNSYPNSQTLMSEDIPERKKGSKAFTVTIYEPFIDVTTHSNLKDLQKITAWCLRFTNNCRIKNPECKNGPLTPSEMLNALIALIKQDQIRHLPHEYNQLITKKSISQKSSILSLNPFMDDINLIRVGGRLDLSSFSYDKKHPILLPKNTYLTELILRNEHERTCHGGPKLMLSTVRERFWPIAGKSLAKKVVRSCLKCLRHSIKPTNQIMGNLPIERTLIMYPFHATGIDYAGPYLIKDRNGKRPKISKAYIALFICMSTKSIHLELVTDLSTKNFLITLKRFIARRGIPLHIYSDNGSNFRGANTEIKQLYQFLHDEQSNLQNYCSQKGIKWHFIPPRSPNFGGLWESAVKSTKHHLKRILTNAPLTYEEFSTVLAEIESILNSRPLTPLSTDPNDLDVLTPSHFLIGRTFVTLPDPDVTDVPVPRLTRYQFLQQLTGHFWKKWSKEYIHELQQRNKWKTNHIAVKVGEMVLLKEDHLPPAQWRLGRILATHPGEDGITRVVTIKCSSGVFKRALSKVCLLPFESDPLPQNTTSPPNM